MKIHIGFSAVLLLVGINAFATDFTYSPNLTVLDRSPGALPNPWTVAVPSTDINDFLIQDVCVDGSDRPLAQDPYTCTNKRNLRMGEDMPYLKGSQRGDGLVVQIQNSYPVWGGSFFRVVRTLNHQGTLNWGRDYNVGDGYDVMEGQGTYSSIMGTRDPQTTDENFIWYGANCVKEDGWMLFPNNILTTLSLGQTAAQVVSVKGYGTGQTCNPNQLNQSYTRYTRYNFTYATGKTMETLKTQHFAQSVPGNAGSFEAFYHTRNYGLTRWEAWKDQASCISVAMDKQGLTEAQATAYCAPAAIQSRADTDGQCNGSTEILLFNKYFYRTACVDNTRIFPNTLPLNAYNTRLTTTFAHSRNLLADGDFASGNPATAWNRTDPSITTWSVNQSADKNFYLSTNRSVAGEMGVKQTALMSTWTGNAVVNVGALVNGPAGGSAKIVLEIHGSAGLMETKYVNVQTIGAWAPVRFYVAWSFNAQPITKVVFHYLPGGPGEYLLDEAYVGLLPN